MNICVYCSKEFIGYTSVKRPRKYCSLSCCAKDRSLSSKIMMKNLWIEGKIKSKPKKNIPRICRQCNKEFIISRVNGKRGSFCSKDCYLIWKNDNKNVSLASTGYLMIRNKKGRYELLHRVIMEIVIKRLLDEEEVVHHINGDKLDNRPENLQLFPNNQEHFKTHREIKKLYASN